MTHNEFSSVRESSFISPVVSEAVGAVETACAAYRAELIAQASRVADALVPEVVRLDVKIAPLNAGTQHIDAVEFRGQADHLLWTCRWEPTGQYAKAITTLFTICTAYLSTTPLWADGSIDVKAEFDECPDCSETTRIVEGTECPSCGHTFLDEL